MIWFSFKNIDFPSKMIELFYLFLELVNNYKHYKHNYFVVYKAFVSYFSDLQKQQSRNVNGPSSYFAPRRNHQNLDYPPLGYNAATFDHPKLII